MIPIQTIRLDISPDADFWPALAESVSDFAESFGLSKAELRSVEREAGFLFKNELNNFSASDLVLELGLADGCFRLSAGDSDGNRLFSQKIPVA